MLTLTTTDVDTQQTGSIDALCHLRRRACPSLYALCGELKPWRHDPKDDMASWRDNKNCRVCGKPTCPKCVEIALATLTSPCPNCGEC